MKTCAIDNCDGEIPDHSKHDICATCRSSRYYWDRKTPAEVVERRHKLNKYGARLDTFFVKELKAKGVKRK